MYLVPPKDSYNEQAYIKTDGCGCCSSEYNVNQMSIEEMQKWVDQFDATITRRKEERAYLKKRLAKKIAKQERRDVKRMNEERKQMNEEEPGEP